jgi:hypothetical protein
MHLTPETVVLISLTTTFVLILAGFFCGARLHQEVPEGKVHCIYGPGVCLFCITMIGMVFVNIFNSPIILYELAGFILCLSGFISAFGYGLFAFPYEGQ